MTTVRTQAELDQALADQVAWIDIESPAGAELADGITAAKYYRQLTDERRKVAAVAAVLDRYAEDDLLTGPGVQLYRDVQAAIGVRL